MKQVIDNKRIYDIYKRQFGKEDANRPFFTLEQFLTLTKQLEFTSVNLESEATLANDSVDLSRACDKVSDTFSEIAFRTGDIYARVMKNSIGGRKYLDFFRFNILHVTSDGVYKLTISPDYSTYYMENYKNPVKGAVAFISNEDIDYLAKTCEMSRSDFILKKYSSMYIQNYQSLGVSYKEINEINCSVDGIVKLINHLLRNGIVGVYANPALGLDSANLGSNCFFPLNDVRFISDIDVTNLITNLETLGVILSQEQLQALAAGVKARNTNIATLRKK